MKIITTAIVKGGTGKTTTAAALAQAAAHCGENVLAIDLDPQCNLSIILGADPNQPGAFQFLNGGPAAQIIQHIGNGLDVIAASPDLATIRTTQGSARLLEKALQAIKDQYNLIVIDTPPTMGAMQLNALQAADGLIIPLEADGSSLQGLYQIADIAESMKKSNPGLRVLGTVITRYDPRPNINRFLRDTIAEKGKEAGAPLLAVIRAGVAIKEAQVMRQSVYEYAPKSKPAADYMALYEEIKKNK